MSEASYFHYWGKAKSSEEGEPSYHLLPYHCLDVAAVAEVWWVESKSLREQFARTMQLVDERQAKAWIMFFIALHDFGKFDIRFQCKAPDVLSRLQPDIKRYIIEHYYHGPCGYGCFVQEADLYGISFLSQDAAISWIQQVAGHHGVIPEDADEYEAPTSHFDQNCFKRDRQARIAWLQALQQLYDVDLNTVPELVPPMLAGFCSVCDWIGSSDYFSYETRPGLDLGKYLKERKKQAMQALIAFGIFAELTAHQTLATLFYDYAGQPYQAHGLQTLIDDLPLQQNLTLIEAPTGSGKTEAALVYAAKLLHTGIAESIIFALPTQATANAMLDRLEKVAANLYVEGANVVLAHGKSGLKAVMAHNKGTITVQGHEEAGQQAVRWLTASKKRAFLGQIGVCTIDQVLLSVLPVKHKFVRSFGIQKSVLIVDEVHAYDSYMYGLLEAVLKQQYLAGGSALLLSATLPQRQREALAASWNRAEICATNIYPLITQISAERKVNLFSIADPQHLPEPRHVSLNILCTVELQFDRACREKIIAAAQQGAKVAVICNLVADAQLLAEQLTIETDVPVDLFHSRYRFIDRQQHEEAVKAWYGKDEHLRAQGGRILVATQVVEQSLDLDFDCMFTHLCPVDLLFQRLGRLHRHLRVRSLGFSQPCCVVIVPEQAQKYGDSAYVYQNLRVLWRTEQLIAQNSEVHFPKAYRDWLERVYQSEPWEDETPEMTAVYEKYLGEVEEVKHSIASTITKFKVNGLPDDSDQAALLTRDGEMNLSVVPVIFRDGYFFTLESELLDQQDPRYWELISLHSIGVPRSWNSIFTGCPEKDGVKYVLMQTDAESWWADFEGQSVRYSKEFGFYKGV